MSVLTVLLLIVGGIALVTGAVILTPLGIIILAFAIYCWNALYPLLLRIGRWSAQRRNFVPVLVLAVILGIVILLLGIAVYGIFHFSGLSLLLFIWLFFMWLLLFGLAALPIGLAIVVWVVRGIRWLWPRYEERFWSAISRPRIEEAKGSIKEAKGTIGERISAKHKPKHKRKYARGLERDKKLKEGIAADQGRFRAGVDWLLKYPRKLISSLLHLLHLR
jgi:hypothetical protein